MVEPEPAQDTTRHEIRRVEAAPGVALEVLDFGGAGDALVLLAGLGNTAHVYDELAPGLTARHHVLAVTRRGSGASDAPEDGYDLATRVADDLAVLDALGVTRAVFVGHSVAGDELTALAARHPERVIAVVYLDAATDPLAHDEMLAGAPPAPEPAAPPEEFASPRAAQAFLAGIFGVELPLGEILAQYDFGPDGRSRGERGSADAAGKIIAGRERPAYDHMTCPALAIFAATYHRPAEMFGPEWADLDAPAQSAWAAFFPEMLAFWAAERVELAARLRGVRIVEYTCLEHHFFLVEPARVAADIHAFLGVR